MVVVDLITGFLGAGKTTFIHGYLHYLKNQGLTVRIIENEFGDVSVDKKMLEHEDCQIYDLSGLCMCCVGKDAFKQMLRECAQSGCDRIIVEPSGIYDVDEFFEVLSLPEISSLCEIGAIIAIADPNGMKTLSEESEYLTFAQFLAAGTIVVSKTQLISEEELKETIDQIDGIMKNNGCENGIIADLVTKPFDDLDDNDYEDIMDSGYNRMVHDREIFDHMDIFGSTEIRTNVKDEADLIEKLTRVFESPSCGMIYRIKGHVGNENGKSYEVNCTLETSSIREVEKQENSLVIIGQGIRRQEIKEIFLN